MVERRRELSHFQFNLDNINKEVTMVLQSLQWERKQLLEGKDFITCSNNPNHRMPRSMMEHHRADCVLKTNGYCKHEQLLPDVIDENAPSVVKLTNEDIQNIINFASAAEPQLQKVGVRGAAGLQPLSLARLQQAHPPAARRAIHDAVVAAAPQHSALSTLPSGGSEVTVAGGAVAGGAGAVAGSRAEELAALRDTRRRRARYRGADTKNYSDTLRTLIHSQMEFCTDAPGEDKITHNVNASKQVFNVSNTVRETKCKPRYDDTILDLNYPNNICKSHEKYQDEYLNRAHDMDLKTSKRSKRDADSDGERRRDKNDRNQKHHGFPNHSRDEKYLKHNEKKINKYSDRFGDHTHGESYYNKSYNDRYRFEDSNSLSKDKHNNYNVESRHKSEHSSSKDYDKEHHRLFKKRSSEKK